MRGDRKIVNSSHPIMSDFKATILVSDVEYKTPVHNLNRFRYVFRYYYPIDLA